MGQDHVSRSRKAEEGEDEGSNTSVNATLGDVIASVSIAAICSRALWP